LEMAIDKIDYVIEKIDKNMMNLAWISTLFMTLMIVSDVLLRFMFNRPLPATFEIGSVVMPYTTMFGFAYTLRVDKHVKVVILVDRLSDIIRYFLLLFRDIVSLLTCAVFTYWSWLRFWESFILQEEMLAAIHIPWWIGKLGMPIGFGALGLQFLVHIIRNVCLKRSLNSGS